LKSFAAKFCILTAIAFNAMGANAGIYKFTFASSNYVDQLDPDVPGTLNGFIVIDDSLVGNDSRYQNGQFTEFAIPAWITQASITFTPDSGSSVPAETRTLTSSDPIVRLRWLPSSGFNPNNEFVGQMSRFSLTNGGNFTTSSSMIQQFGFPDGNTFEEGEFLLSSPVNAVAVPGPLPLLGLFPFAYYFQKLKKKFKKN